MSAESEVLMKQNRHLIFLMAAVIAVAVGLVLLINRRRKIP